MVWLVGSALGGSYILEQRSFPVEAGSVDFVRRRVVRGERQYYSYSWIVHSSQADYQFISSPKEEMTPVQLEMLENMVHRFRLTRNA